VKILQKVLGGGYFFLTHTVHKLQSVQNSLTRVVLPSLRHLSASERLSYFHWLPVHYRIQFKIATLIYKILATCQPSYLYIISYKDTTHHGSPFFNLETFPGTILVHWFRSARLQLQLSCNMEFNSYFH